MVKALDSFKVLAGVDPAYKLVDPIGTPLCKDIWQNKYRNGDEPYYAIGSKPGWFDRVGRAINGRDGDVHVDEAIKAMEQGVWMPAGRILAGAGTDKRVTLLNCFVNATIEDDMESIAKGLGNIMLTQQQGGGIGTDFSLLRPPLAVLRRTGSVASGPGPFIDVWDSACTTIRSAGDRRGAMMGTLICSHPFLPEFIKAKQTKGKWTNFNVSILITDDFMGAVQEDEDWYLHHPVPPSFERPLEVAELDFVDNKNKQQYVYAVHKARDLWDMILQSTYEYAEPGVIFIDRVNDLNNLYYVEEISCTNPCGEQPLPPHGCCDLGAVQLSRMVRKPFDEEAEFDWDLHRVTTHIGTRFLDNVIDVTNYPLPEQRDEQFAKRRIGLGIGGLADAMAFLCMRYGSPKSITFTERVMRETCFETYRESIRLAKEKGPFPLFDRDKFLAGEFVQRLPDDIKEGIFEHGIRNGVGNTIAPTGTTSIAYGNPSSGLEPVFLHSMRRKVRQENDDKWKEYDEVAYGARLWLALNEGKTLEDLPTHMNTANEVRVHEHVRIQEVCQRWVDASISKTINLPTDISYEAFKDVYSLAYDSGLKGCTTYRPSETRGSILSDPNAGSNNGGQPGAAPSSDLSVEWGKQRPEFLPSNTCKISWPGLQSALYLTIGYKEGRPFEVFLNSKDQRSLEWMCATSVLMTKSLRRGVPLEELAEDFSEIAGLEGGWAPNGGGKMQQWPSLIAYMGYKMQQLTSQDGRVHGQIEVHGAITDNLIQGAVVDKYKQCPSCKQYTYINNAGCDTCTNCGHSKCG